MNLLLIWLLFHLISVIIGTGYCLILTLFIFSAILLVRQVADFNFVTSAKEVLFS